MDWSLGLEPWSGVLEWIFGTDSWCQILEWNRKLNSDKARSYMYLNKYQD